jgi:CubicO group peptidase (beta-lactamase class C family)
MKNQFLKEIAPPAILKRRRLLAAATLGSLSAALPGLALSFGSIQLNDGTDWNIAPSLDAVIEASVASGHIVGLSVAVAHRGRTIYKRAAGFSDREARRPIAEDELFRLASMTKQIVCVAALALVDQGLLDLNASVTRWLPEFQPKLRDGSTPEITLRHLMTHTAGLGYGFLEAPDGPYHQLGISDGLDHSGLTLQQNLQRIAAAPLLFEPGSRWHYSVAIDVLGAVIERATAQSLPQAVRRLVTQPLGLAHTDFVAPEGAVLATPYGDASPVPERMTDSYLLKFGGSAIAYSPSRVFDPTAFPSGGTGMFGTASDYLKFVEAMRTGGQGVIFPETAALMTTNAIGNFSAAAAGAGYGWGLGAAVLIDPERANLPLPPGSWNWSGVYGTGFWVDPINQLSVVALTNTAVAGMTGDFPFALRKAVYFDHTI